MTIKLNSEFEECKLQVEEATECGDFEFEFIKNPKKLDEDKVEKVVGGLLKRCLQAFVQK